MLAYLRALVLVEVKIGKAGEGIRHVADRDHETPPHEERQDNDEHHNADDGKNDGKDHHVARSTDKLALFRGGQDRPNRICPREFDTVVDIDHIRARGR